MDRIPALKSLLDAIPLPALIIGRTSRILVMNRGAELIFSKGAAGMHYTAVIRQPQVLEAIERSLFTGEREEARFLGKSIGNSQVYRAQMAPLSGPASIGILATFEDISREEGVGQMRRDFVANVSHELRTPLTALIGFIETLRGPAASDPKAQQHFLGMMEAETARMTRLVQDLLSLSRVESEERIKPDERVDLAAIIRDAVSVLDREAQAKGMDVSLEMAAATIWVTGDQDQLTQVFRNLVENAIKYGSKSIRLVVTLPDREPYVRGPGVIVDVIDDGEGIEPHHLPRLTERFYRVDSHRSRAQGGTGLGLAIVKHVVGRHRGRLRITSVPGEGSTFSVILPRN